MEKTADIDNWGIETKYVLSLDPGWGSSSFAILISRYVNGKVQIIYAEEKERANFSDIISEIWRLKTKCNSIQNILLDASATEMYTALCNEYGQNPSLQYLHDKQAFCKKVNGYLENHLFITPIAFSLHGQEMLTHTKWLIEEKDDDGTAMVAISKRYDKLITSLRSAYAIENRLDKERTVHDDLFDALRINLSFYRRSND